MHVHAIDLSRFTVHAALRTQLPPRGIVLVTGPNGAGKTSLIEAVAWAVFGESVRGVEPWPDAAGVTAATVDVVMGEARTSGLRVHRAATVTVKGGKTTVKTALDWQEGPPATGAAPAVTTEEAAEFARYAECAPDLAGHGATPSPHHPTRPAAQPVYENRTKSAGALGERVGPFDRWCRTHVFLARDGARFAAATDGERKRALEAILGLDVFDGALKQCRVEAREVAGRLAATDGSLAAWRDAHARACQRAAEPLPAAPDDAAMATLTAEIAGANEALRVAVEAHDAAERRYGESLGARTAANTTVTQLADTLKALTAPPPASPPLPFGRRPPGHEAVYTLADGLAGVAKRAIHTPPPAATLTAACPTCKRPWGPAAATAVHAATLPHPHTSAAPHDPAAAHPGDAPTPHAHSAPPLQPAPPDPTPIREALDAARQTAHHADLAVTEAQTAANAARMARNIAGAAPQHLAAKQAAALRERALRDAAIVARDRAAAEARELDATITAAEAATADLRAEAATLAAADTALGLGGIRARVLSHALPFLGFRASTWLSRLGRPAWRVTFESTRKAGVRGSQGEEAITMTLHGLPKPQYAALSGGEAKRVDLALLLALGELATAIHGAPTGTLWFDEVLDAPLDAEGAAAAGEALRTLARDRAVVVIAHSPAVVRALHSVVHITLGGGGSVGGAAAPGTPVDGGP